MTLNFHADDYGINIEQAKRILSCSSSGVLNSVSIMPNSDYLSEAASMLPNEIKRGIHINFVEGKICSKPEEVPLLHKNGIFCRGFVALLILSLIKSKEIERQAYTEILAQIKSVTRTLDKNNKNYKIRIDSHRHYHMIPGIFKAMCRALKDSGHEIEYIRYPEEVIGIYIKSPSVWRHIPFVNLIKVALINFLGLINKKTLRKYNFDDKTGLFFGVTFTGKMYGDHVKKIINKYIEYARIKNKPLEVLFHPGGVRDGETLFTGGGAITFYRSEDRNKEAEMLKILKGADNL